MNEILLIRRNQFYLTGRAVLHPGHDTLSIKAHSLLREFLRDRHCPRG
jgi:hypothetical protein